MPCTNGATGIRNSGRLPVSPGSFDPTAYLNYLREQTAWIDIRGVQVGAGTAHRFPIELLYIPLTIGRSVVGQSMGLEDALTSRRLVIVGDPGSGKTTFLRRVAFALCEGRSLQTGFLDRLAYVLAGISKQLPFPIVIRIAELAEHIRTCQRRGERGAPTTSESPPGERTSSARGTRRCTGVWLRTSSSAR